MKRLGIFLLLVSLSGCATQTDVRILEDRIIALERRNLELQQQTAEVAREKKQIRSKIDTYEETLDSKEQALRDQSAGLVATTDRLRSDIQVIQGRLDEDHHAMTQKFGVIEDRLSRVEKKLELEPIQTQPPVPESPGITGEAGHSRPPTSPAPSPAPTPPAAPVSENELYIRAKQAFDREALGEALEGFQKLLLTYPGTRYADNAQFWIGEIYYREKKYEQAILEYQTVIEKFPQGNKVKASLLKQAFAFAAMGDNANARLLLQELIAKFPGSNEAKIAQQKLKTL